MIRMYEFRMMKTNVKLPYNRQSGGTLLGLIIGLICGLGIAVVVALMITKSPIPFVNKVTHQERPELSPGQASDPNLPLYGNRDTVKDAVQAQEPAATGAGSNSSDSGWQVVSPDPAAGTSGDADGKWTYFLQAGAFGTHADAENARARLALLGFEATVSERPSDANSNTLYRVRIGPFARVEAMNQMRKKLSDNGIDAAVVRVAK